MAYDIEEIQGVGPAYAQKLQAANIKTTDDLLNQCCTPSGRNTVSQKTGLNEAQILKWTNMADMMRISGIGPQYAELLEGAGVDTVKELRNRNHENLAQKMKEVNEAKKLAKTSPAASVVEGWIEQAKSMAPKITY
jgi:predicted flap endonuclease-1-like 5' DNA nuclease